MTNIALIPARGGSKSIKKKNIVKLGSHPLIYYTINVAQKTELIDRIIVSTDDQEIKDVSLSFNAEVPFLRPQKLAGDHVNDFEVVYHLLQWLKKNEGIIPDSIIYLRPDFPFRHINVLNKAIELYNTNNDAHGLRSVQESKEIPYKTWLVENGYLHPVIEYNNIKDPHNAAWLLFPQTYWPVGYIEIYDSQLVLKNKTLRGKRMIPYIIEEENCINIGSLKDLKKADRLSNIMRKRVFGESAINNPINRIKI